MTDYSKWVRASAIYDLIITSAFALPLIAAVKVELLRSLHTSLALTGVFPAFHSMHLLFVNLLGSLVLIWSVLRIRQPLAVYGMYDALCRGLFSVAMGYALFAGQGSGIIWFFLIPEISWGIAQGVGYWRHRFTRGSIDSADAVSVR